MRTLGRGAAIRAGDKVDWLGAIYALQTQLGMTVHPGGKTALGLLGLAHNLPMGRERVTLFSDAGEKPPKWFSSHDWGVDIRQFSTSLFSDTTTGLTRMQRGGFQVAVSSAERAIMEVLYGLPGHEAFDEVWQLFEGLTGLRPDVTRELLLHCSSVKVKRLFMVLAETLAYPWLGDLDVSGVDFGKGKRVIARGGRLDLKYQVTVPKTWGNSEVVS